MPGSLPRARQPPAPSRHHRHETLRARQSQGDRSLRRARQPGQGPRRRGAVFDFVGRRIDGSRFNGNGELAPVAVEDGAAPRRDVHPLLLLALGPGAVLAPLRDLELHETRRHDASPQQEQRREAAQAAAREAVHELTGTRPRWAFP
jgi:hypothetical protein